MLIDEHDAFAALEHEVRPPELDEWRDVDTIFGDAVDFRSDGDGRRLRRGRREKPVSGRGSGGEHLHIHGRLRRVFARSERPAPRPDKRGAGRLTERASHGATGLIVWVLAGNKAARAFYEALGATLVVEQPFEWDGMPLVEAGYGWRDLGALVTAAGLKKLH